MVIVYKCQYEFLRDNIRIVNINYSLLQHISPGFTILADA